MFWNKDKELVKFAEREAKINAAFQIECADSLEKASNTLFAVLLSGGGGGLALAVSLFEKGVDDWLWGSVAITCVYLFAIAAVVAIGCLQAQDMYPPANDPKNLFNENNVELGIIETRKNELKSRQFCIDKNRERNGKVAWWLNQANHYATITPVFFIVIASFFYLL